MFSWILFPVAPLPALWFNGVLALLVAVSDAHPGVWVVLGTTLLGLAVWSTAAHMAAGRVEPSPDSETDPNTPVDATTPPPAAGALRTRAVDHGRPPLMTFAPLAALALVALGLVALGLVASMVPALVTQHQFEDGARVVEAPVVALADFTPVVEVEGQRIQVSVTGGAVGDYPVGQLVPVRVNDSVPGRAELLAEPNDPSWRTGLAGLAAGAALGWWTRVRPQDLRHLAKAPVMRATATATARARADSTRAAAWPGRSTWTLVRPACPGARTGGFLTTMTGTMSAYGPRTPRFAPDDLTRWADAFFEDEGYEDEGYENRGHPFTVDVLGIPRDAAVVALAVPGHEPVRGELRAPLRRSAPDHDALGMAPRRSDHTGQSPEDREPAPDPNGWRVSLRWPITLATALAVGLVTGWFLDGPDQTWWDWLWALVFIGWTMPAISSLATGAVLQHPPRRRPARHPHRPAVACPTGLRHLPRHAGHRDPPAFPAGCHRRPSRPGRWQCGGGGRTPAAVVRRGR
ncbi:hypothetical protein [Luteococcus sp.]|uniref:hypothetical protein n=1 Tax=Luteococcus sp. TaxID=1969402 RepID=UPI0037354860